MNKRSIVEWQGYIPAITTPFDAEGALDFDALGNLLDWLHGEGMHGLVIAGTTGEWTSMSDEERAALFSAAGNHVGKKLPLLAGCSAFTAERTVALAEVAGKVGFSGILVTPPPYLRPNAAEIENFYRTVAAGSPLPVCIYNWPPGTGIDLDLDLLERLTDIDNIVAVKQSTGQLDRFIATFFALRDKVRIFGHAMDEHGLALLQARGGDGTMGAGGVLGHHQPDFYNHLWAGEIDAARQCGCMDRVLMKEWYTPDLVGKFGSGPAILKAALDARGLPGGHVRAPLLDIGEEGRADIRATLTKLGCISA
ncbi:dihydrodipicolinate synthase family protein [Altericroceibacterium endophyticum]|uniref:Dihydrodipicolinate synthase family protein n=1 Tax=Altericroceibacterium endophyticum TaxID=1808508 RepID=A0A6I4TBC3_9SPHN|nr:dihydrodipicolinate synthase family protein [Altericroceibacterium endophyticum]MXO67035.1 dihydrodipicolinate synthase family protein [Altericroceibacterium endophyticum]